MIFLKNWPALSVVAFGAAFFGGCAHPSMVDAARLGPFYAPGNFAGDANLGALRRRDHAFFLIEARVPNAGDLFFNVPLKFAKHDYASSQFRTILPDLPSSIVSKPSSNL